MEELENKLSTALAALCSVQAAGPGIIPLARALEAVSAALEEARRMRGEREAAPARAPEAAGAAPEEARRRRREERDEAS